MPEPIVLSGSGNHALAAEMAELLHCELTPSHVVDFPDGEMQVCLDAPVRGHEVIIIQPTGPPATRHLFELLLYLDACRRAGAASTTAVVPYFGYARGDKRHGVRESITASLVARMLENAGLDHLITLDLHAAQIEGFFHIPVENLTAVSILCDELREKLPSDTVVVSPDEGRVKMAAKYAGKLGLEMAVVYKERISGSKTKVLKVAGEVRGRPCLIIDDMITTGGTMHEAMQALKKEGARPQFWIAATHAVFTEGACEKLSDSAVREVLVTDSIPPKACGLMNLRVVNSAPLFASAVLRLVSGQSMGELFE
jgi:ribose-phosphate pyrophosphokinase